MKRIFNKRLLSFLLALLMVLEMAPLSAVHVHAVDNTDLSIDFNYQSEFPDAESALLHEANEEFTSKSITLEEAEDLAWAQIYDGDLKREGGKFREYMESSDPDEKYIVLSQDVELRYGSGEWVPIKITSDKVLDLNGFTLTWWDKTNKEDGENWQSTNIYDHYKDKVFIEIRNGATLTIIDSSATVNGYDTGKGTGKMVAGAQIIDAYEQQLDYYTHRDLFLVNGNLVIYGGTFQAGRQKDQYKSNFSWDKLADCLGKTLDLGLSIAEYATGLDAATAAMKDVETDIANRKPAQGNTSDSGENGTSDSATNKPTGQGGTQNQTVDTPASAGSADNSQDRAQTVGERTGTDTTNNNTNNNSTGGSAAQTGGQNQANGKGTAKEDKNSLIAAEEKKVVAAALDKEKIMDMWDKGAAVVNSIGSMLGNAEGTRTTQTIWGTVAKVNASGTLVTYGGTFQGYGASPNLRNATFEIVRTSFHAGDKEKDAYGGRAYIFGGIVEGYSGANCFNFVRAPKATQTGAARAFLFWAEGHDVTQFEYLESTWTGDYQMNDEVVWSGTIEYPYTYELDESETNNMEILHYENQDEFVQNPNLDPIPIDTSNVVVRGGTFRTYSELTNQGVRLPYMKEIDSTGKSMTFVKFTGTSGSVNLGLESFGEDMIRDGRIQLVDVYGDGTLVLMDEIVDEAHPAGLKHYRLYCGDTELRHIRYLDVYPMNAGANSTHSFSLQTYYGNEQLYNISTWNTENDEENDHSAPFAGDEYFFDYTIDDQMHQDIYVKPNLGGKIYDTSMQDSEAWYYPEPVDNKGNPIPDFASTIAMASFTYTGDDYAAGTYQALTHGMKDLYIFKDGDYDDFSTAVYKAYTTDSYRENIKWFRYRVYRVDPITRENISESDTWGVDQPLAEVVYGVAEDDAMRCKLNLYDLSQYLIEATKDSDEPWTGYKKGELYRIVFNVDEYVNFGFTGDALGTTNAMSFKYKSQTGDDWSIKGTHERQGESFAGYMPVASTESSVLFRCSSASEVTELPNTNPSDYVHYDSDYTPLQFGSYAVLAGEDATINFMNAKVSQCDNAGTDFIDVYYQWYVSDDPFIDRDSEDPTVITDELLAGITNVCLDWSKKSDHLPYKWNPDADIYEYRNSLSPDDPNYEEYGEDGLADNPEYWTMYDLHAYTTELRQDKLCMKPGYTGNLTLQSNNPFAFNTDSCYIPEEIAGKYVYVRAIVTNLKDEYTKIYDKKQVFYSHPMLVIDPSMLLPETQEPAMDLGHISVTDGAYVSKTINATVGQDMLFGFTGYAIPEDLDKEGYKIRLSQKVYDRYTGDVVYEADNGEMINLKNFIFEPGQYYVQQTQALYYQRPYWSWEENQFKEAIIKEEFVTSRIDRFAVTVDLALPDSVSVDYPEYFSVGEEITFTATVEPEGDWWYRWILDDAEYIEDCTVLQDSQSPVLKYTFTDETPKSFWLDVYSKDAAGNESINDKTKFIRDVQPGDAIVPVLTVNGEEIDPSSTIYVEQGSSGTIMVETSGGVGDIRYTAYKGSTVIGNTNTISYDTSELGTTLYEIRYRDDRDGDSVYVYVSVRPSMVVTNHTEATQSFGFSTRLGFFAEYTGFRVTGKVYDESNNLVATITDDGDFYDNEGKIAYNDRMEAGKDHTYRLVLTDYFGNTETLTFTFVYDSSVITEVNAKHAKQKPTYELYPYGEPDEASKIFPVGTDIVFEVHGQFSLDPNDSWYDDNRERYGNIKPTVGTVTSNLKIYYWESWDAFVEGESGTNLFEAEDYCTFTVNADGSVDYYYNDDICDNGSEAPGYYRYTMEIENDGSTTYGGWGQVKVDYILLAEGQEHTCAFNYHISENVDGLHHTWHCICGKTQDEEHKWNDWFSADVLTDDGTWVDSNMETRYCHTPNPSNSSNACYTSQYRLAYVESLTLDQTVLSDVKINDNVQLNASLTFKAKVEGTTLGGDGDMVDPDTRMTWASSDESVATVDENGKVTFVGVGTATITVSSVAKTGANASVATATCTVTVACDHQKAASVAATESTCSVAGCIAHYECGKCGTLSLTGDFTDTVTAEDVALPLAAHEASNVFGYNEEGHFRTCKYGCGYQFGAATAHTYNVSAADCTTAKYCTRCKYEAEAKHGHDLIYMDELPATCTEAGIAACYNCMECGRYFYDEAGTLETTEAKLNIRALGHQWADATCTDPKTCTREGCGITEGEALGHSWHSATCETPETCGRCGETNGSALGHNWQAATCLAPKTCSTCLQTEGDKLPHSHDPADATCTTDAICPVCNQVIVPATGHSFSDPVEIPATCTEDGSITGTCTVCGETTTEVIPALGHDYVDGTCQNCGEAEPGEDITVEAAAAISYTVSGNVVTVTHSAACKVGYLVDGAYVKITGTKNADGSYSFEVPTGVTEVVVVVAGDVSGDGKLAAADKGRLNAALLGKATLDAKAAFAADVNGDGKLAAADKGRLNATLLGKATLTW